MNSRKVIKKGIKIVFRLLVLPLYLLFRLLILFGNKDGIFQSFSQFISLFPGKFGIYVRAAFYHLACPNTSENISIGFLTIFSHQDTTIHEGVYIGPQCNIGMCTIGKKALIGSNVNILSGNKQHNFDNIDIRIQDQGGKYQKINIGENCWLGNCSVVMQGIADGCVIAAGSVVTKEINEEDSVLAGNPAKFIRSRNSD